MWEPNLTGWIQSRLKPGDCFIDVGANIGYFSLLASILIGQSGKAISIEVIQRTFEGLTRNLDANHSGNERDINMAVWDKEETLTFFISPDTINGTSTVIPAMAKMWKLNQRCHVRAAPLYSLLSPDEISAVRLIKIDVEGVESRVISGFGSMLENGRRDLEVVIEVSTQPLDGIVSLFHKRGFFPYHLENDYSIASYIGEYETKRIARLEVVPHGVIQVDVVFSRVDAATLP